MAAIEFKDSLQCYAAIGSALSSAAPPTWQRITIDAALEGIRVSLVKLYETSDGQQHDMPFVPTLAEHFYWLARLVSTEEKGLFKKCRFTLERSGKYHADFQY